jgi:hypothetical protein
VVGVQARTEEGLRQVAEALRQLSSHVTRLEHTVGDLKAIVLEVHYRDRAASYFDDVLRRIHALTAEELVALLDEAEDRGAITAAERRDLLRADVVARGRQRESGVPAYLAVEVSAVVDEHDVWRALRRAEVLSRAAATPAIPAVAGERIDPDAEQLGRSRGVWRVLDGQAVAPQAAPGPV